MKLLMWPALALLAALAAPAWADSGLLPDPTLTPGQARTTNIGEVCSTSTRSCAIGTAPETTTSRPSTDCRTNLGFLTRYRRRRRFDDT
jgi:hypothetical protein